MNTKDSVFYDKALGCLVGGLVGDAMGAPTEDKTYEEIEKLYGFVSSFSNDPDETVPCSLACLYLADGDAEKAVIYGANFGRDADTIATMAGAGAAGAPADGYRGQKAPEGKDSNGRLLKDYLAGRLTYAFK